MKLTNQCNLSCVHCIAESGSSTKDELSLSEILSVIDELSAMRVFYIGFTGGEPLLHPNIYHILEYATKHGLKTGITTNGSLITPDVAKKLKNSGVSLVRVSLDGHTSQIHDWFRGQNGSFLRTCSGIRHLIDEKLSVTVLTVVSKHNFRDWEKMITICQDLGVHALNTYVFVPEGRGRKRSNLALSPYEYRSFLERVLEIQSLQKDVKLVTDAPLLSVMRKSAESGACPAGICDLFIKENGEVTPCPYFPQSLGNIRNHSLSAIWKENDLLAALRSYDNLSSTCRKCDFVDACFGGCRAAAYCMYGTISATDPNCWLATAI